MTRKKLNIQLLIAAIFPTLCLTSSSLNDDYFTIGAHLSADGLNRALRGTVNDLLLHNQAQKHVESLNYERIGVDARQLLDQLHQSIDSKFGEITTHLKAIGGNVSMDENRVEMSCDEIGDPLRNSIKSVSVCCSTVQNGGNFIVASNLTSNLLRESAVDSFFLYNREQFAECPPRKLSSKKSTNWKSVATGLRDPNERKDVVIAIDFGGVTSELQMNRMKSIGKILTEISLENDRYSVIAKTANGIETQCSGSSQSIKGLHDFIDRIRLPDVQLKSSHPQILYEATGLWRDTPNTTHILHYISRGMLSELSEAPKTLEVLAKRYFEFPFRFRVNTFAIGDENRTPLLWSTEFLESISKLDFTRYRQSMSDEIQQHFNDSTRFHPSSGELILLNGSEMADLQLNTLLHLGVLAPNVLQQIQVFDQIESESKFFIKAPEKLTMLQKWENLLIGCDLDVRVLVDSMLTNDIIVHSPKSAQFDAYLLDLEGKVLVSSKTAVGSSKILISDLDDWLHESHQVISRFTQPNLERGEFSVITRSTSKKEYLWQKLSNAPFILLLGYSAGKIPEKLFLRPTEDRQLENFDHLVYFQFDLQRDLHRECAHHGSLSVANKSSLFLSSNSFEPAARKLEISEQLVVNYWVYLTDRIGLIRSSAMKRGVREEAAILAVISKLWTGLEKNPSVNRRFAATRRGLLVSSPAAVFDQKFDPTAQKWYTSAMASPGKISITGPIADPILGDLVTLSTTIGLENQEILVLGVEVSMYYLSHIIQRSVPSCNEGRRCLLLSSIGNAVSIPDDLLRRISVDAVERYHVAHVDPILASHLLSSRFLFEKSECQDPFGQLNHHFHFNLTFNRVLSNGCSSSSHRQPLHSEILLVPQTNAFLALINETCSKERESGHFCPCSVSDRRCLFCARFDATECECPCQCSMAKGATCHPDKADRPSKSSRVSLCKDSASTISFELAKAPIFLEECHPAKCETIQKQLPCDLTSSCTWCHSEMKESKKISLVSPRCLPVSECYRGLLGRAVITSSKGSDGSTQVNASHLPPPTTPLSLIGPIVFLISIILLFAIYSCYRTRVSRLRERRICSSDPSGVPLCARFHSLDPNEDFHFDHEGLSHEKLVVLASFERSNGSANPQRQQRGPPTVSDLGYSTMTEKTGDDSDAGIGSSHPTVRLRVNDGGTVSGRTCSAHLSRLVDAEPSNRQSRPSGYIQCSPYSPYVSHQVDPSIPSSSSSVVTTEVDIHPIPLNILPQLIE